MPAVLTVRKNERSGDVKDNVGVENEDWFSNQGFSVVFQANNMKATLGAYPDQNMRKEEEKSKSHEADIFPFAKLMVYLEKINILSWKCNEVGSVVNLCLLSCKVKGLAHVRTSKLHTSGLIKLNFHVDQNKIQSYGFQLSSSSTTLFSSFILELKEKPLEQQRMFYTSSEQATHYKSLEIKFKSQNKERRKRKGKVIKVGYNDKNGTIWIILFEKTLLD
ncbi:hypothetical protein E5288_WYG004685 [Bos mutus]|uniref:Uncharacterized protein n=1 Tax=Bos mutus TaxID=72004 RepID=A0A6B0RMR0_9CETA|nr:hypothetical protein [Bos mutus]